jgi:hypothetical protein
MSKDQKAIFLAILTTCIYGFTILLEKGQFLYPFPLNEFIFFAVSIQFAFWNHSSDPAQVIYSVLAAFFFLLSSPYFWTFFMNSQALGQLIESPILDFFHLFFYICLVCWAINSFSLIVGTIKYLWMFLCAAGLCLYPIFGNPLIEVLVFVLLAIIFSLYKLKQPFHLLWVLLAFLFTMKAWVLGVF